MALRRCPEINHRPQGIKLTSVLLVRSLHLLRSLFQHVVGLREGNTIMAHSLFWTLEVEEQGTTPFRLPTNQSLVNPVHVYHSWSVVVPVVKCRKEGRKEGLGGRMKSSWAPPGRMINMETD